MGIIPNLKLNIIEKLTYWILETPLLSIVLGVVSFIKLDSELKLLDHTRKLNRPLQDRITIPHHNDKKALSELIFSEYGSFLIFIAIANLLFNIFKWITEIF